MNCLKENEFITYMMRPINGGKFHLRRPKFGEWVYQLKPNGQRLLINLRTLQSWNRHGSFTSRELYAEYLPAIRLLSEQLKDVEWVDAEGLLRRHNYGKGSLVVLDIVDHIMPLQERREHLSKHLKVASLSHLDLTTNQVCLVPQFEESCIQQVGDELSAVNIPMGANAFYEGVVAKSLDSPLYKFQKRSEKLETPQWVKHRWI